jgi:putative PIN family toxin of toxin-antitoxin system
MIRVVLDTNVVVSATLVPSGTQAIILLLALTGQIRIYVSEPVLTEYEEVLRRPRLKLATHRIEEALNAIRMIARPVRVRETLSISPDENDNRFLECAEAARADYLVTGNTKHFPVRHKTTTVVTGRQFLNMLAIPGRKQG